MLSKRGTSENINPLVECVVCGSVVEATNAEAQWVNIRGRSEKVWLCKGCMRLGRGEQARKYIMRAEKHGR